MAFTTHTRARRTEQPRPLSDRSSEAPVTATGTGTVAAPAERDWPTDTHVWNWAHSAVFSGYGPGSYGFV